MDRKRKAGRALSSNLSLTLKIIGSLASRRATWSKRTLAGCTSSEPRAFITDMMAPTRLNALSGDQVRLGNANPSHQPKQALHSLYRRGRPSRGDTTIPKAKRARNQPRQGSTSNITHCNDRDDSVMPPISSIFELLGIALSLQLFDLFLLAIRSSSSRIKAVSYF